jgi:hypothetical protein
VIFSLYQDEKIPRMGGTILERAKVEGNIERVDEEMIRLLLSMQEGDSIIAAQIIRAASAQACLHVLRLCAAGRLTETLNEQLTDSSTRLSKFRKACPDASSGSSLWQRYWIAVMVGAISALPAAL